MNHVYAIVCHNLMQKDLKFNGFAIVSVKGSDHRIHFWFMSKRNDINIQKNLNENSGLL